MVEICSIRRNDETGDFEGMTVTKQLYREFITEGDSIAYVKSYRKDDYDSYENFAAIMGKFDPYLFMLQTPVTVEKMSKENLNAVWEGVK